VWTIISHRGQKRKKALLLKRSGNKTAKAYVENDKCEVELYSKYGYAFYVGRKCRELKKHKAYFNRADDNLYHCFILYANGWQEKESKWNQPIGSCCKRVGRKIGSLKGTAGKGKCK
jgi:hypothetical protein